MTFVEAKNQASQIVRFLKKFEDAEAVLGRAADAEAAASEAERRRTTANEALEARKAALEAVIADLEQHKKDAVAQCEAARAAARSAGDETGQLVKERREAAAEEIARLNQSLETARTEHGDALARLKAEQAAEEEKLEAARDRRAAFIATITGDK